MAFKLKITIIGGSGFVGTNLCKELMQKKIDFEIIDLKESRLFSKKTIIGDVRKLNDLREKINGNVVINLAAVHRDDVSNKEEYYQTNVVGAENIVKVCSEKKINKIIFTSSVAVYGFTEAGTDELGEINPFNEYGKTKYQAEQKFKDWQTQSQNKLVIVRPTVIFGEGNRGNVFNLFKQVHSGKFLMIGRGNNKKSMAYIGNVAAFLEQCIHDDQSYSVYNYVDTPDYDMNNLIKKIKNTLGKKDAIGFRIPFWIGLIIGNCADYISKITGKNFAISAIRVKKFCASSVFLSSKQKLNGFEQVYTLDEGIDRTLKCDFIDPHSDREEFFTE